MAKKHQAPLWAQMGLVWFVLSTLSAFGLLYLRASESIGDGVFQPLTSVVCAAGDRLETTYVQRTRRVGDRGDTVYRGGRQQQVFSLDTATCIAADGAEHPGTSFVPAVWTVFAIGWGALVFVGWLRQAR